MNNNPITIFGEVLFDHFPNGNRVLGGAPFNVAWHLHIFRQAPHFISRIGSDAAGDAVMAAMHQWGMDLSGVQRDSRHPTGGVYIVIEQDEPAYTIMPEQAYDFIDAGKLIDTDRPSLLYHGTLALRNPVSRTALVELKNTHPGRIFMDVNLREPWWHLSDVLEWITQANWIKLNHHELAALYPVSGDLEGDMQQFIELYDLQGLIVTHGKQGAVAIDQTGLPYQVAPSEMAPVIDTVGAGDAFASVLLLGLNLDWPLQIAMERAQAFASALVRQQGATVRDPVFYAPFIEAWGLK